MHVEMPVFSGLMPGLVRRRWLAGAIAGGLALILVLVGIRLMANVHAPVRVGVAISAGALGLVPGYVFTTLLAGCFPGWHPPDWLVIVGALILNPLVYGWTWSVWSPNSPAASRARLAVAGLWVLHVAVVLWAARKQWS